MGLEPNRPPCDVASETALLENVAFEPNRPRHGVLDVPLLGDTSLEPEKVPTVDDGLVAPNSPLLKAGWVDSSLPEGAECKPNRLLPGDCTFF